MKKTFKRTLVSMSVAAITMGSFAANAYTIGETNDSKVEVYGVVSISAVDYGTKAKAKDGSTKDQGWVLENETRVGFRAAQAMTDSVEAFVQMESGWMLDDGAKLGNRDTFAGIRGDEWGAVRFGRMLTPMYELVDWPYSASNMGTTFDRGWRAGERFHFDRKSQHVRYDSAQIADMLNFSLSYGNGSENTSDSNFVGGKVSVTPVDMLTLHAAFELTNDTEFDDDLIGDTDNYFVGFEFRPIANLSFAGAYKTGEFDSNKKGTGDYDEREIDAYSLQANYFMGNTNFRLGYASQDGKTDGVKDEFLKRETLTGEVGYSFNAVYTFLRVAQHSDARGSKYGEDTMIRIGTEWYF
ncbi:porin [Photobacterium minamisatsumaniensis]|uniref:porin n=1 Tax=Photobacterium minamisatsumaniensis TaxID=2910233 RepID=UPI003D14C16B